MPNNQEQEFKIFGIPVWMRKYIYGTVISGLITLNLIQWSTNKKLATKLDDCKDKMYQEMKAILDREIESITRKYEPPLQDMQKRVDSLDNKINHK